jgi:4-carboxymuconolactone decarboxylase
MARTRPLQRSDLPPEAAARFDQIAGDRGEVPWLFRFLLSSPELTYRVSHLGDFLRAYSSIPDNLRELVILVLSRRLDFQLEWSYHEELARSAGVADHVIAAVRDGDSPAFTATEAAVTAFALSVLERRVTDDEHSALEAEMGTAFVVDLVTLVAFVVFMQYLVEALDVGLPVDVPARLPATVG